MIAFLIIPFFLFYYMITRNKGVTNTVYILRGLPGSGKSCWIENFIDENCIEDLSIICSANEFFLDEKGFFKFNPRDLPQAYSKCFNKFMNALKENRSYIFINNPNAQYWEYENYETIAKFFKYQIKIIEIDCPSEAHIEYYNSRCNTNVPSNTSLSLYKRWEEDVISEKIDPFIESFEGDCLPFPLVSKEILDKQLDDYMSKKND